MDGQRPSPSRHRRSKRARTDKTPKGNERGRPPREEPILIAARRPNSPATYPKRRFIAASAAPRKSMATDGAKAAAGIEAMTNASSRGNGLSSSEEPNLRRAARIVQVQTVGPDDREKQRLKLIDRLLTSEGRVAITRAARELESAGFDFPVAQDVQLQLLEHIDESFAHQAIANLAQLLVDEVPIKRPLFEQRLRRLEQFAEDLETRQAAADLRRTLRA